MAGTFGAFLQAFQQIDAFQWDIFDAELSADQKEILLSVRVDFRGQLKDGDTFKRLNDRAVLKMTFAAADNNWSLNTVETVSSERLVSTRTPTFVNSTDKWKLNELPVTDRQRSHPSWWICSCSFRS